jgi:hypothetical protein
VDHQSFASVDILAQDMEEAAPAASEDWRGANIWSRTARRVVGLDDWIVDDDDDEEEVGGMKNSHPICIAVNRMARL